MKLFNPSFIEVYDHCLTDDQCQSLIDAFESSPKMVGRAYIDGKLDTEQSIKKDIELQSSLFSDESFITHIIREPIANCISQYSEKYQLNHIPTFAFTDQYSFQKYSDETDGFKQWHTERGSNPQSIRRVLVWTIYLNNAKSGTEFIHYGKVKAKTGRIVIWPADFSHIHRSELPNQGLKYIITGWTHYVDVNDKG